MKYFMLIVKKLDKFYNKNHADITAVPLEILLSWRMAVTSFPYTGNVEHL